MFSSLFDKLKRSWLLTRITLRIVFTHDRELLVFPLVNFLLVVGASLTSSFVVSRTASTVDVRMHTDSGVFTAVFLLLLLTNTMFGMCITHTTRVRLEGGDASLWQSLKYGLRNYHRALAWMMCSIAAALLLSSLRKSSTKVGVLGRWLLRPIASLLEVAWGIAKLLVIPAIVYEGHGPIDALKASVQAVKRTWGEALTRHLGFSAISNLLYVLGIVAALGVAFVPAAGSSVQIVGFQVVIGYFTAVIVLFHLVNTVFNAALYHYATRGEAGLGFSEEILGGSIRREPAGAEP